ncbi:hypothetical protein JTE90_012458 [Oedothorax gibbosus]|uniref:DALR anticodon binding domain-containing protein n=1 Tax=Oedothorax gibbosus TaxID=931172 RepID=A0AAV6UEM1_9ARAC|nr:hypothetical protein JTE90_012458 [Oedothorax gibbosus]
MASQERFECVDSNQSQCNRTYFFVNFENEVQVVFNNISKLSEVACVTVNIMKGSIYLKGDYFISLKSANCLQLNCNELLAKLKAISCVLSVEVDSKFNLVFFLDRSLVYKMALMEVFKYRDSYGMTTLNKSALIMIDDTESRSFYRQRNKFLAEHITSILSLNKIKVFNYSFQPSLKCQLTQNCTEKCSVVMEGLLADVETSEWRSDSHPDTALDARRYLVCKGLLDKYGKAIEIIIPTKDNLNWICMMKHFIEEHIGEVPDFILHIASQGQNRNFYRSGILLSMLVNDQINQVYIFNQSVQYKSDETIDAEAFVDEHRREIVQATMHKYDSYKPDDITWTKRIEALTNTAVMFEYLKQNHSSVLNLKSPSPSEKNFGVFAQYNFARLSNLFKNFEEKVAEGFYHPLPQIEDIDFNLLKLEEEWNLFHYVLSFPKLVQNLVKSLLPEEGKKFHGRLNRVCVMLQELCQLLSLYYSRIRILSGQQPHLQKTMNARLWLLRGVHQIFKNSFLMLKD